MKKKKRRRQKERRKEKEKKMKRRIRKNEKKEKYGKISSTYLYPSIPFHFHHVYIHILPLHTICTKFYLSFSTIIIHIIWENN